MRLTFYAVILAAGLMSPLHAQQAPNLAIQSVIAGQITAFQVDDFARAFAFASPTIKGIFRTPDVFGTMVRNGYPMVHRPRSVQMLDLREVGGALWQRVLVTDAQGASHLLDYQMVETPDGWQINAVQLLPQSGVGA